MRFSRVTFSALVLVFGVIACDVASDEDGRPTLPPADGIGASGPGATGGNSGRPLDEAELEENFRSPVVSGPFLWSANPETNRVARIDARTFDVEVKNGGYGPTFVAALPGEAGPSGAAVINVFGGDASIFLSSGGASEADSGQVSEFRLPIQRGASAWAIGPSGKFAIAWSEFEQDLRGPLDGYQDLSVLSLAIDPPTATRLSVGFRPTQVVVSQEETRAFIVSDPGLSVLDLTTEPPSISRELLLPDSPEGTTRDVSFTPDGEFALVRLSRSGDVLIVRVADDARAIITLPSEVTDLDLSSDGTLAIAVMRGQLVPPTTPPPVGGQGGMGGDGSIDDPMEATPPDNSHIALLPIPEIFDDPSNYEVVGTKELVGSVVISDSGSHAVLYTSAIDSSRALVLDLRTKETRVTDLQAPIQAIFLSEDGKYAAAIMTPPPGSNSSGAFALFMTENDLPPRITGTATVPRFIAITGDRALVTTWGSQVTPAAAFLGRFPQLSVDRLELENEPLASGMVPDAGQGFVAQAHPEGQVTFINFETGESTEVSGFELSSRVVEE